MAYQWRADITLATCCQASLALHEARFPGALDALGDGQGGPCPECGNMVVNVRGLFIRERRADDRRVGQVLKPV